MKNKHKIGFFFKSCFDRIEAFWEVLILIFPLLVIGILAKFDSQGPILFFQKRIGKEGKPITGSASIKYRNEKELLAQQANPKAYNDNIIWPDKVKINLDYLDHLSFFGDIRLILKTIF